MKKVSVIVPCHNVSLYLDKCMEHLLHQTIGIDSIEIILVDDASTDHGATWEVISKYEQQFPDTIIAISLERNMRQGGARNVGLSYASGEYLMFCDADDWLALDAMEHLYQRAIEYNADVVQFHLKAIYELTAASYYPQSIKEGNASYLLEIDCEEKRKDFLIDERRPLIGNCTRKFYRTGMVLEHHFRFAEHLFFEEPVFTVPVLLYERRHYFLDEELYYYYKSPHSTMRGDWKDRKMDYLKVWMNVVSDLETRGLLQRYYNEISYLFFREAYAGSIYMLVCKKIALKAEELKIMINTVLQLFPDILENPYLLKEDNLFRISFRDILTLEITQETTMTLNAILMECMYGKENS